MYLPFVMQLHLCVFAYREIGCGKGGMLNPSMRSDRATRTKRVRQPSENVVILLLLLFVYQKQ